MGENADRCFIITPIGNDTDPIRRHIEGIIAAAIEPAIGEKYEIVVAHKIGAPGSITKQIIKEIYSDKLVIANLTNKNPNVMYELAFRHSLGKPVIMIAEDGTALPSDIIMERTVFYKNDAQGVLDLRDKLIEAEKEIPFDGKERSPIYDVINEIYKENKIMQLTKEALNTDEKDKNALEYILNKLNNIEESIRSNKYNKIKIESISEYSKNIMLRITYESAPEGVVDPDIIRDELLRRLSLYETAPIVIKDIMFYEKMHEIIFCIELRKITQSVLIELIYNILTDIGFKNMASLAI